MYTYFLAINCNKQAITLDLGAPQGHEIIRKLLVEWQSAMMEGSGGEVLAGG